jgi:hypothetical protein
MSGDFDCWTRLKKSVEEARCTGTSSQLTMQKVQNRIMVLLQRLAKRRHCSGHVIGWIEQQGLPGHAKKVQLSSNADGRDNREGPALKLRNLCHLKDDAVLGFMVTVAERAPKGIRAYTVSVQGELKHGGMPWYARIDLTEWPEGQGLCAHPLLHCHVGSHSDEAGSTEAEETSPLMENVLRSRIRLFSPRVPLPWLLPWEALEWLLATVEPTFDPTVSSAS